MMENSGISQLILLSIRLSLRVGYKRRVIWAFVFSALSDGSKHVLAVGQQQIVAMVSEKTRLGEVKLANTMQQADGKKK